MQLLVNNIYTEINIAAEMESFAIFYIAPLFKKDAACLLTVIDSHFKNTDVPSKIREKSLDDMDLIALNSIIK